jgi:hypothetical protein
MYLASHLGKSGSDARQVNQLKDPHRIGQVAKPDPWAMNQLSFLPGRFWSSLNNRKEILDSFYTKIN